VSSVVQFDLSRNIDAAAGDIRRRSMPPAVSFQNLPSPPNYKKVNPADLDPDLCRSFRLADRDGG
jgi:hypothetical protein